MSFGIQAFFKIIFYSKQGLSATQGRGLFNADVVSAYIEGGRVVYYDDM